MEEIAEAIGMPGRGSLLVSKDGERFLEGTKRHCIAKWHGHNLPSYFWSHDDIDNHLIDLGSWYDMKEHVLCIEK